MYMLSTMMNAKSSKTLFSIQELNSSSNFLNDSKPSQISYKGIFLVRGDTQTGAIGFDVIGNFDQQLAANFVITRFTNGVGDSKKSMSSEPLDVFVGSSARTCMKKFSNMIVLPTDPRVSTLWPAADRGDMALFKSIVQRLLFFIKGYSVNVDDSFVTRNKPDPRLNKQRLNLLREQGMIQILLSMINKLKPISERIDSLDSQSQLSDEEAALIEMGNTILSNCFDILMESILNNAVNQMYVADFMPVLLAHLGGQPVAGKCVSEMLNTNLELQETKIGQREISIFAEKLRKSKMNSMYLDLIRACCSCMGNGVDNNQCKIADALFEDMTDIIIQLSLDFSKATPIDWDADESRSNMYLVDAKARTEAPIHGEKLLAEGLPTITMSWTSSSFEMSPMGIFGKLSVNIEELFLSLPTNVASRRRKGRGDRKQMVADYLVAEMFLGAEMSLDRNYVAMSNLDPLFPFEGLVSILLMNVKENIKSAAANQIIFLYVDRDPQIELVIPCLTRTWTGIQQNGTPKIPTVEPARRNYFALLQEIISIHLLKIRGQQWSEYSFHMLHMLQKLVKFNFYGSNEKLQDVIFPLLDVLDRRGVVVEDLAAVLTYLRIYRHLSCSVLTQC